MKVASKTQSGFVHASRSHRHFLGRLTLIIGLAAAGLVGPLCVAAHAQEQLPKEIEEARKKAAEYADKLYGTTMKINKDVATAINIARAVLTTDPFAFINAFLDLLGGGGGTPDITVRQARDEIIAELRKGREEELVGRASALSDRFGELLANPQNMTFEGRLENYIDDAADLFGEIDTIMNNGDPARADYAYHLAPTYNLVTSSRIAGLATGGLSQATIDNVMAKAYSTDLAMVSSNGTAYGGYVNGPVQKNAGYFYCSQWFDGACGPSDCGVGSAVLFAYEMDLSKGWVLSDYLPTQWPPDTYPCGDPMGVTQQNARYDADPIVHFVRASAMDLLLAGITF